MWPLLLKGAIAGATVMAVIAASNRSPRLGAFLLTLPVVSILAFLMTWQAKRDIATISTLARETLVLVPLGLPFFIPLALASRFGLGFWTAFGCGLLLASATVGSWLLFGPRVG